MLVRLLESTYLLAQASKTKDFAGIVPVEDGAPVISANQCMSLLQLRPDYDEDWSLKFEFLWSPAIEPPKDIPSTVTLRKSDMEFIERVAYELSPKPEAAQELDFVGSIKSLNGHKNSEGEMEGEVTLSYLDVATERTVRAKLYLQPLEHGLACDAYKKGQFVKLKGKLEQRPHSRTIFDITEFHVLD